MPDKDFSSLITEMAKLRITIDVIPNYMLRMSLESEFNAKRIEAKKVAPAELQDRIDEMIDEEIIRLKRK